MAGCARPCQRVKHVEISSGRAPRRLPGRRGPSSGWNPKHRHALFARVAAKVAAQRCKGKRGAVRMLVRVMSADSRAHTGSTSRYADQSIVSPCTRQANKFRESQVAHHKRKQAAPPYLATDTKGSLGRTDGATGAAAKASEPIAEPHGEGGTASLARLCDAEAKGSGTAATNGEVPARWRPAPAPGAAGAWKGLLSPPNGSDPNGFGAAAAPAGWAGLGAAKGLVGSKPDMALSV